MTSKGPPEDRVEGIRRAPRRQAYENLPVSLIRDGTISYRALGVLVRLLSNADNFRMSSTSLSHERKEGREAVRAALRELQVAGYIVREKVQNSRGQWSTFMVVSEVPHAPEVDGKRSQSADSRASVSRSSDNRASVSRALKNSTTNDHYQKATTTSSVLDWNAVTQFSSEQREVVVEKMEGLPADTQQDLLDELAGALRAKAIKGQWPGWLHGLIRKAREGSFKPSHALTIQSERERRRVMSEQDRREHLGLPPVTRIASREVAEAAIAAIRKGLSKGDSA